MNFLKDVVLGLVGLIALNSMGYLAMNTSMGYDIIVFGCIIVVELLVLMWFVKWIHPRAEEETTSRGKRAPSNAFKDGDVALYNFDTSDYDALSDYEAPDIDLKEAYDSLDETLENCDVKEN